jgi:hypothetical protein
MLLVYTQRVCWKRGGADVLLRRRDDLYTLPHTSLKVPRAMRITVLALTCRRLLELDVALCLQPNMYWLCCCAVCWSTACCVAMCRSIVGYDDLYTLPHTSLKAFRGHEDNSVSSDLILCLGMCVACLANGVPCVCDDLLFYGCDDLYTLPHTSLKAPRAMRITVLALTHARIDRTLHYVAATAAYRICCPCY